MKSLKFAAKSKCKRHGVANHCDGGGARKEIGYRAGAIGRLVYVALHLGIVSKEYGNRDDRDC